MDSIFEAIWPERMIWLIMGNQTMYGNDRVHRMSVVVGLDIAIEFLAMEGNP